MTEADIKGIVRECRNAGYDIRIKDIIFLVACRFIKDAGIVYRCIYDKSISAVELKEYETGISFLKRLVDEKMGQTVQADAKGTTKTAAKKSKKAAYKDITFEENKDALIKLLEDIKHGKASGELDIATALKLETDIRTKLNDKFDISDKKDEHRIVVNSKYNDICPHCRREIRRKTDEDMMNEIRQKYILTPKTEQDERI